MIKSLIVLLACGSTLFLNSQNSKFCEELSEIVQHVESSHYSPKPINDSLSKNVHQLFLKQIDEHQRFFSQTDIDLFEDDIYKIDDYITTKNCGFLEIYATQFEKRILEAKVILEDLKTVDLDYSGKDSLYYRTDKTYKYFKDHTEASRYWNKKIRYEILKKLVENDSILQRISSDFKTLEAAIKPKIIDNEICLLDELMHSKGSIHQLVEFSFLDAFLKYQDPNSAYFSASDKQRFEQSVSNSQLSYGISTEKKPNGDIIISYIAPGSAAFKQGEFEVNDIILALENANETIETYCTSNETILGFINNASSNRLTFTIKKQDGQKKTITLKKSTVAIEANSITGYIIEGKTKTGYISIPGFYTDLEAINGLGVANDVAKQIYKLQREGIQGLIIDLRFNGGGSMKEAIDLTGMFIDRGPVAISTVKNETNYTIRDPNRGTIFTKPIVVLVNQFSASASELFAAALQDYNTAILVGTPTHGKASSQMIIPLKSTNFIKLTLGQFFRVSGQSHQQFGVVPDIILPSIYDNYKTQETYMPYVMANTSVDVTLKHKAKLKKDLKPLKANSTKRLDTSRVFKAIRDFNQLFVNAYINREGTYPLTLEYIFNDTQNYMTARQTFNSVLAEHASNFTINNSASTEEILQYNDDDKSANKIYRQKLREDPYIQEAYAIINDIFKL